MSTLTHRLLQLFLTGALLLPLCWGAERDYTQDYYATATPDYDEDNSTIDYFFWSNTSIKSEVYEILGMDNPPSGASLFHSPGTPPACCLLLICLALAQLLQLL
ncbi:uncharacterized protein [Lepisosteus oculatus]|uniref:uncharacterized protein n=1 Tax=Lepisosteus oculatus TaxID=7918 RepID=UPI003720A248